MKEDQTAFHSFQRIAFAVSRMAAFLVKPAALVKGIFTLGTDHTDADSFFGSLFEAPFDKTSPVTLPLVARVYGEAGKIP